MTDKDHLEGVKNLIDKYENCYDKEIALKYASDLMRYHARYFVKQTERVQELEEDLRLSEAEEYSRWKQNKRYREAVEELIDSWKDNVKSTKQHNESDYSIYREGLIEALQFAIDDLELALEESK